MDRLETKNLVKKYHKRTVVDQVSLSVSQGEIVGLLGPNGAGKTTTFRMVVGLISPDSGKILWNEKDISHLPMYKRARMGIGYLPQEPTVFARLSVKENIEIILEGQRWSRQERERILHGVLEEMQLTHLIKSKAGNLSGGERRRLEIARTLALSPSLVMLDEPFAAVDPKLVEGLQEIIENLKQRGIGVLITDHKADAILSITDRAYVINKGKILKQGTSQEILDDPKVREVYLGEKFVCYPQTHLDG